MECYPDEMMIEDAVKEMFHRFNIPSNAYTAKSFYIQIGNFALPVPNIPARVRIARFHDMHHVLTGYPANWLGEAEIGAWELATGCRHYFIAWFLNSGAVLVGLCINPKAVIKAFYRGTKTRTNLYHNFNYEDLLTYNVRELKSKIGLVS